MAIRTRSIDPQAPFAAGARRRGFTLAESLIASVVLAVAVVAVSGAIVASQSQTAYQIEDTAAINLGRQLMEEIVALPLSTADATSWPTVTDRTQYDRVNDFAGYKDIVSVPIRRSGSDALSGSANFASALPSVTVVTSGPPTLTAEQYMRSVTITYPTTPFTGGTVTAGDFATVKVTVMGSKGNAVELIRLVGLNTITR